MCNIFRARTMTDVRLFLFNYARWVQRALLQVATPQDMYPNDIFIKWLNGYLIAPIMLCVFRATFCFANASDLLSVESYISFGKKTWYGSVNIRFTDQSWVLCKCCSVYYMIEIWNLILYWHDYWIKLLTFLTRSSPKYRNDNKEKMMNQTNI